MKDKLGAGFQHLMRPPGAGIPTISAGKGAEQALQAAHFEAVFENVPPEDAWEKSLEGIASAKVAMIGVPLDTGAGIRRGAAYGPRAVREALLADADYRAMLACRAIVDLGDVFVNPHLLHDEMLNEAQIRACQEAMYSAAPEALRRGLPVSALSQLKRVMSDVGSAFPSVKFFVIGGDHSVAWPVSETMVARFAGTLGIVQPDAHTDLLPARFGVKYCFGTWSFHANELLGRSGRMVQLGIRQSGRDRSHWETTTGVRQFWADEIAARPHVDVIRDVVEHLRSRGVKQIYFSNDIDGTDEAWASATGTPASGGMTPEFLLEMIDALGSKFELVAADIMEVAPDLARSGKERAETLTWAARYAMACLRRMI